MSPVLRTKVSSLPLICSLFFFCFLPWLLPAGLYGVSSPRDVTVQESPELHKKLQEAHSILKEAGLTEPIKDYKLRIVAVEAVNAEVFPPTNTILFTRPLVDQFSVKEISLILSHEIAHVKLGHYGKRVAVSTGTSLILKAIDMAIPGAGILSYFLNPAVTMTFSRSQEIDADIEAVRTVKVALGYPPEEYVKVLQKLRNIALQKGYKESDRAGLLDTHPNIADRISKIRAYAQKNKW
jgi:Zn-dependent protease with chaperone function